MVKIKFIFNLRGCGIYEKNISTQQSETIQNPWVFSPNEHGRGT
jgi:hypothetical protein